MGIPQSTEDVPPTSEYAMWLKEAERNHRECQAALAMNPEGGCFYRPRPMMIHSGLFWRCAHGRGFWARFCFGCALRHPVLAFRWHFWRTKHGH